ncbi:hypothetical protein QO003_003520 [Arthrobacter silviterrae]|uniref:DUF3499 domain-containing protein n=1 Tax=Arthrobacter silviterrae TaxID=2026658 RepID=A0ABX0DE56_9MICC|nr:MULTISPECIES: DUF3499 domain-containing protein [Arthrobacter]MCU6481666.1 DUF3499 domain-containing protein [Arthrobacter sp. A2-55]MDQ0279217.1 hypothetical protein [Arthrobacter silviterrae]NGN83664.1 DUF3499 domain-containing protein [Arthrobacter silviterrae]
MGTLRQCTRSACRESAVATLTYVYADSTAVLGPLATFAEPHCYDLCSKHSARLTVPLGWEVIRLARSDTPPGPGPDDLLALADAVREAAAEPDDDGPQAQREPRGLLERPTADPGGSRQSSGRRGHLHILRD